MELVKCQRTKVPQIEFEEHKKQILRASTTVKIYREVIKVVDDAL